LKQTPAIRSKISFAGSVLAGEDPQNLWHGFTLWQLIGPAHNSSYAKRALMKIPSLEDYEQRAA
jgi:hypothetical protein